MDDWKHQQEHKLVLPGPVVQRDGYVGLCERNAVPISGADQLKKRRTLVSCRLLGEGSNPFPVFYDAERNSSQGSSWFHEGAVVILRRQGSGS